MQKSRLLEHYPLLEHSPSAYTTDTQLSRLNRIPWHNLLPLPDVDRCHVLISGGSPFGHGNAVEEQLYLTVPTVPESDMLLAAGDYPSAKLVWDTIVLARINGLQERGLLQIPATDVEHKIAQRRILPIREIAFDQRQDRALRFFHVLHQEVSPAGFS